MDGTGPRGDRKSPYQVTDLRWLYGELLRVEAHWTGQVRDQQARISALLTVSGILLGFGTGFLAKLLDAPVRAWPICVYVLALVGLCLALFMGIRALRPGIEIADTALWLNQEEILKYARSMSDEELLCELCASAKGNQETANHRERLKKRRRLMDYQVALLMLSLGLLLLGALAGVVFARSGAR